MERLMVWAMMAGLWAFGLFLLWAVFLKDAAPPVTHP